MFCDQHVAIGARRLAIIDLDTGRQPLSNEDGSICVTQNGEIYNYLELREDLLARGHHLRTKGDTEAIVDGVTSRRELIWVPVPMRFVMSGLRHVPRPLFRRLPL